MKAFRQMKDYYNDITRENLKLIRSYKDEIAKINAQIISNSKALNDITAQNEELKKPLEEFEQKREILIKYLSTFPNDKMTLRNANARLTVLRKEVIEARKKRDELEVLYAETEK